MFFLPLTNSKKISKDLKRQVVAPLQAFKASSRASSLWLRSSATWKPRALISESTWIKTSRKTPKKNWLVKGKIDPAICFLKGWGPHGSCWPYKMRMMRYVTFGSARTKESMLQELLDLHWAMFRTEILPSRPDAASRSPADASDRYPIQAAGDIDGRTTGTSAWQERFFGRLPKSLTRSFGVLSRDQTRLPHLSPHYFKKHISSECPVSREKVIKIWWPVLRFDEPFSAWLHINRNPLDSTLEQQTTCLLV